MENEEEFQEETPELLLSVKIMLGTDGSVLIDTEGFPQSELDETNISRFLFNINSGMYTKHIVQSLQGNMEANGQSEEIKRVFQKWYNLIENTMKVHQPIVKPTEFFNHGRSPR